jgi:hypothetical protein
LGRRWRGFLSIGIFIGGLYFSKNYLCVLGELCGEKSSSRQGARFSHKGVGSMDTVTKAMLVRKNPIQTGDQDES